ncbi:sulfotransferase domain-containing protein, partial [Hoeflea sp.]|uniref:sulfotransferase domain-containing protein n=1 Tax=Hoeflea sp. TaxID=1940281 RepID=UPI0019959F01
RSKSAFAPDFIVIGAMKAGTTTLSRYLAQFDEISMSRIKETDYFIEKKNYPLGEDWYRRQFDLSRPLVGEASPNYTKYDIFPGVPERIAGIAPGAKLIFIARDPVARFASHYRHSWSQGHMQVAPADLLASSNGRHMIECSRYGAQIDRYLVHFDRCQLLFLDFDELCRAPQQLCDEVADFLGIARRTIRSELPANTADQIANVPRVLKRAARTTLARKLDHVLPMSTRAWIRAAWSFRKPDAAPTLDAALLDTVSERLREDARHFRDLSGREFSAWRV